ncbi:hypothetical protein ACQEU8_05735 [Streptomyces sp. CA-250714]|uniref:hypothetical protein n=1 Tax=Streptomyces sp. CA-250714 TaxID=3240060 RepID=UPI003D8E7975
MSKRQKGRKHRKVNRTPRPVGSAVRTTATRATATGQNTATGAPAGRPDTPAPRPAPVPEPASAPTPPTPEPTPTHTAATAAESAPTPGAVSELFRTPARDGGLGQSAGRTWERVRVAGASGTTVEELSASVGYQERTVLKHLQGLAEHGLVEQHEADRWRALPTGAAGAAGATGEQSAEAGGARVPQRA